MRGVLRNGAALILFVLGVLGTILPIMPGVIFLLSALIVMDVPQKRAALRRLEQSWLMRKLLQSKAFARTWRRLRRHARHSDQVSP